MAQICPNIFFFENRAPTHFRHCHFASLCKKSEKNNESTLRKAIFSYLVKGNFPKNTKIRFLRRIRIFREKPLQPFFRESCPPSLYKKSEKSNDRILPFAILDHCAKNQKKLMSQSREKLLTDERTDEQTG